VEKKQLSYPKGAGVATFEFLIRSPS